MLSLRNRIIMLVVVVFGAILVSRIAEQPADSWLLKTQLIVQGCQRGAVEEPCLVGVDQDQLLVLNGDHSMGRVEVVSLDDLRVGEVPNSLSMNQAYFFGPAVFEIREVDGWAVFNRQTLQFCADGDDIGGVSKGNISIECSRVNQLIWP